MALTNCHECKREISSEAEACPHCGAKPNSTSVVVWLVAGAIGIWAIGAAIDSVDNWWQDLKAERTEQQRVAALTPEQRQQEAEAKAAAARAEADRRNQERAAKAKRESEWQSVLATASAVRRTLHDPGSAEWEQAWLVDNGTVVLKFRARNAYGAKILNTAVVTASGQAEVGTERKIAGLWNKYVAGRPYTDFSSEIRGAMRLGAI